MTTTTTNKELLMHYYETHIAMKIYKPRSKNIGTEKCSNKISLALMKYIQTVLIWNNRQHTMHSSGPPTIQLYRFTMYHTIRKKLVYMLFFFFNSGCTYVNYTKTFLIVNYSIK